MSVFIFLKTFSGFPYYSDEKPKSLSSHSQYFSPNNTPFRTRFIILLFLVRHQKIPPPLEGTCTCCSLCIVLSSEDLKSHSLTFFRSFLKCHFHTFPNPSFETYNFSLFSIYAFYILFFSNSHITFYHAIYFHFCLFVGYFHKLQYKLHECLVK